MRTLRLMTCLALLPAASALCSDPEPYATPLEVGRRVEITLAGPYRTDEGVRIQVPWTRLDGKETLTLRAGGHAKELAWASEPGHVLGVLTAVEDAWLTLDLGEKRPLLRIPRAAVAGAVPWETLGLLPPDADPLPTGQLIRVVSRETELAGQLLTGRLLAIDDETLLVKVTGRAAPLRLRRSAVEKLDVSRGKRSRAGEGALIGGVALGIPVAVLGGLAAGAVPGGSCQPDCLPSGLVGGLVLGVAIGAPIGALIGSASRSERWERVPFSVAVTPQRRGARAALTLRF